MFGNSMSNKMNYNCLDSIVVGGGCFEDLNEIYLVRINHIWIIRVLCVIL